MTFVAAYSERTGDDEDRQVGQRAGPEAAGQGSAEEAAVRWISDPDPRLSAGLDRHRRRGGYPVRAALVRGADRTRCRFRWGGARHRTLVSGAGAIALHAAGAGDFADRRGHAWFDLSRVLLPGAAPDRTVEHPREEHAPDRQQRQPALDRRDRRAQRAPAGTRLGPRGVRQEYRHRPLRPGPEPYRELAEEHAGLHTQGFQLRGDALRHNLRRDLPPGRRAEGEGGLSEDRPGPLPPRRSRLVGSLRRLALALPRRARVRGHDPGRPGGGGAVSARRALRHFARRVGVTHGDHPLPRRLPRGYTRGHSGPRFRVSQLRVVDDHRHPDDRGLRPDPTARRQLLDSPHPGPGATGASHPRRPRPGRLPRPLRFLQGPPAYENGIQTVEKSAETTATKSCTVARQHIHVGLASCGFSWKLAPDS